MQSAQGKPLIVAAIGARGTGKSAYVKQLLAQLKPRRLAVWDLMQEYSGMAATAKLGDAIRAMRGARFAIAFHPSRDDKTRAAQFDVWCKAVLLAGDCLAIVEELRFVTSPSWAPPAWREMTLLGRHEQHRLSIVGTSQRPAQVDKDFLGNCDLIHCGRLVGRADAKVAAEVLGVYHLEVLRLADLAFIERAAGASTASRGTLKFRGAPRVPVQRPKDVAPKDTGHTPAPIAKTLRPVFSLGDLSPATPQRPE